jgi:hypothetical protein
LELKQLPLVVFLFLFLQGVHLVQVAVRTKKAAMTALDCWFFTEETGMLHRVHLAE